MRVAILGAGYAGLTLAQRLEGRLPADVDITLINDSDEHLVRHEVHRIIRRPDLADTITVPLDELLNGIDFREARVADVDPEAATVTLAGGDEVTYDYGAVCLGSETAYYDLPGVRDYGLPLKSVSDALAIRDAVVPICESGGRIVVGGAGLSGIQTAGEIAALASETRDDVPTTSESKRNPLNSGGSPESASTAARDLPSDVEVVLLERLDTVAPTFPDRFSRVIRDELETRGVTVKTGTAVEQATDTEVMTESDTIPYDAFIWTGGITGPRATGGSRPRVRADLRVSDSTFVVGDAARVVDADGEPVPASASAAIREARTVAGNLAKLIAHKSGSPDGFGPRLDPYRFDVPGWIVSVGDGAVAQIGPTVLTGAAAKATKATVGAGYLGSVRAVRRAVELAEAEFR